MCQSDSFTHGRRTAPDSIRPLEMDDNCFNYIPSVEEYFAAYSTVLIVLLVTFGVVWSLVSAFYAHVVKIILANYEKHYQPELIICSGIYVVVVTFCIVSLSVPVLSEKFDLASYIVFSWCIFAFFRYIHLFGGGHDAVRQMYEPNSLRLSQGKLLQRVVYKILGKYIAVRFSIVQFPILTTIISLVQIVFFFVDQHLYFSTIYIFLPISMTSIILYLIAFSLLVNYIEPSFPDQQLKKKFQLLRLVVLFVKVQVSILEIIFRRLHMDCDSFVGEAWSLYNLIKQPLIVTQMTLLAYATWMVYKKEAKKGNVEAIS